MNNFEEILAAMGHEDINQNNPHHFGSLGEHTDAVVGALPETSTNKLRAAALLHDIGKIETKSINPKTGNDQFIGHATKSVAMIDEYNLLSGFSDDEAEYIKELVRLHDTKYSKQNKCKNMLDNHPIGFAADLITLQFADVIGQSKYKREEKLNEILSFANLINQVGTPDQVMGVADLISIINKEGA